MAINKKLIHFKNKENFEREVANGNILDTSIVFILDTKEIYTHGTIYDGSTFDPSDIETSILEINNRFNISLEYDLVEYPDILDENNNPIFTSVEEGQTLERAINTLEINVATLAQEVLNNEEVVSEALVDTANSVGLDENFHYIQNIDANYISSATSLAEADLLLDLAIKEAKEVFIITPDMFEETATTEIVTNAIQFTEDAWSKFKSAVWDHKIIGLSMILFQYISDAAVPLSAVSDNYAFSTYVSRHSADSYSLTFEIVNEQLDIDRYEVFITDRQIDSIKNIMPDGHFVIDETMFTASVADEPISSFELTYEYKQVLARAISTNKVIGISNSVLHYLIQNIESSNVNARGELFSGFSIINLTAVLGTSFSGHVYYGYSGALLRIDCSSGVITVSPETMLRGGDDGTKFLSNDGTYKEVSGGSEPYIIDLDNLPTEEAEIKKLYDELVSIIPNNKKILLIENEHYITSDEIYYQPNDNFSPRVAITFIDTFNNNSVRILDVYPNYIEVYDKTNFSSFSKKPYIWDGTTSETIFNELVRCITNNRPILYFGQVVQPLFGDDDTQYLFIPKYMDIYIGVDANDTIFKVTKTDVSKEIGGAIIIRNTDRYSTNELQSNTYRNFGILTNNIIITYYGYNQLISISEYQGEFSFGDTVYTVTFPNTVKWSTDSVLEYKANHTYQFRIVNGLGVMKEFANS